MNTHEQLQAEYLAGDLCLFVGAGVSMGCGLPDWKGLAKGVVQMFPRKPGPPPPIGAVARAYRQRKALPHDPNLPSVLKGGAVIRPDSIRPDSILTANVLAEEEPLLAMRYGRSDPALDLCSLVCRCLYSRSIALSETVLELPSLDKVKRICCFNYDDILDRAFAERGRTYKALFQGDRIPLEAPQTIALPL